MSLFSLVFRYKDKKSPDKLGFYPEKFHVSAFPERRYLWASRILVICAVFSICVNIALTFVIYMLPDQITSYPELFVASEKNYTLDRTEPLNVTVSYKDLLSEKYISDYIKMRHEIPKSTADLFYRWDDKSKFYWYSGGTTYHEFMDKINKAQIKSFIKQKVKRTVEVDHVKNVSGDFWIAQFRTYTSARNMEKPDVIIWKAYLRIMYSAFQDYENIEKNEIDKINYVQNPFGFKVMSYEVSYAGKPEKAYSALQTAKKVHENLEDVVK